MSRRVMSWAERQRHRLGKPSTKRCAALVFRDGKSPRRCGQRTLRGWDVCHRHRHRSAFVGPE